MPASKRARKEAAPEEPGREYAGWQPGAGEHRVERVPAASLSAEQFFERYVAARRPVVLEGGLDDVALLLAKWTDDYLRLKAGHSLVKVERRPTSTSAFGCHSHERLSFSSFLEALKAGEDKLYLTTEASSFDEDGRLRVVSQPLPALLDDVPVRPRLAGRLVPVALNLWFGRSARGASSGLHHDWHDNVYELLRGRKRFDLYAPSETARMYPHGEVERVHANGRINYCGMPSRADGADAADLARVARLDVALAERSLAAAEAAVAARQRGAKSALRRAEEVLEDALAAALEGGDGEPEGSEGGGAGSDDDSPPPHFSRCRGREEALRSPHLFPLFAQAHRLTAELEAGDALYLPCGFWHEVTSSGAADAGGNAADTHLALNWWFAPPDTNAFEAPYSSDLWERDFAHWQRSQMAPVDGA